MLLKRFCLNPNIITNWEGSTASLSIPRSTLLLLEKCFNLYRNGSSPFTVTRRKIRGLLWFCGIIVFCSIILTVRYTSSIEKKRFLVSFFDLSLSRGSGYRQHKRIEKESRKRFETTTKNQKVVSILLRPTRNSKRKQVSSPFGKKNRKCKYPFPSTNPFLFQCSKPLSFSQCSNNSNLFRCWCNGQFSLT